MLNGKRALVTGSTSGIGEGVALALAQAGAEVIINGFGEQSAIDAQVAKLNEISTASFAGADMSKPSEIEAMFAEIGDIDILVNNAGIQFVSPVEDFPTEKWDAIINYPQIAADSR